LGVPLEEHIAFCIAALREHADALGLRGTMAVEAGCIVPRQKSHL
jgi:hypothetical protein